MNRYEIFGVVGEGAYGIVLKCKNKETGEIVAVKKFKENDDDEIVRKTTVREVKTLRSLQHANIVSLKEAFRRKGKLFLVFEYVEQNLLEVLEQNPKGLNAEEVRFYIYELMKAVHFCHRQNIVHRDIKPENLLITPGRGEGRLKLCDFGFARVLPTKTEVAMTDYVSTRWYRSPELLLGCTRYGAEVDLWAIGCIMAELMDGQPLFPGDSDIDQLYVIQKLLGPLTMEQTKLFLMNRRFVGFKFPDMSNHQTLDVKYQQALDPDTLQFLKGLLEMDPGRRWTAATCLQHPYLSCFDSGVARPLTSSARTSRGISRDNAANSLLAHQRKQGKKRGKQTQEDSRRRDVLAPSDDDSTVSVGTRVTIELDASKTVKPTPRKRQHVAKHAVHTKTKERCRLIPPSRDEGKRTETVANDRRDRNKQLELNLNLPNTLQPIRGEKRSIRKKELSQEGSKQFTKESGLRLQTPQISHCAPTKSLAYTPAESYGTPTVCGNSMTVLNPEMPAFHGVPAKNDRERRLATRHGFPNPRQAMPLHDLSSRPPPSRQGSDKWTLQARHSISSQGRFLGNFGVSPAAVHRTHHGLFPKIQEGC